MCCNWDPFNIGIFFETEDSFVIYQVVIKLIFAGNTNHITQCEILNSTPICILLNALIGSVQITYHVPDSNQI